MSSDRIYKREHFLWYNFNRAQPEKNIQGITDFLQKVKEKSEELKFQNVCIVDSCDTDCDGDTNNSLVASGYRLETDKEYVSRLKTKLLMMARNYNSWKEREIYYKSEEYNAKLIDIQDRISKIEKCVDKR